MSEPRRPFIPDPMFWLGVAAALAALILAMILITMRTGR
jgi:hypothetical protein